MRVICAEVRDQLNLPEDERLPDVGSVVYPPAAEDAQRAFQRLKLVLAAFLLPADPISPASRHPSQLDLHPCSTETPWRRCLPAS